MSEVSFGVASAMTVLVLLEQVLELRARSRTNTAIRALLDLSPKMARRVAEDSGESDLTHKPQQLRGLNEDHDHDLKNIFKGADCRL